MKNKRQKTACFLFCTIFAAFLVGCNPSPAPVPSSDQSSVPSIPSSTNSSREEIPSPSEASSSMQAAEKRVVLEGKTIASMCGDDINPFVQTVTFVLTPDGKVYYYGAYQDALASITETEPSNEADKKDLYEISFPEPIVKLVPYAAIGESGTLYIFLYPPTAAWMMSGCAAPAPMTTIKLSGKIRDICYNLGDFFVVTEEGELYSIGEMTLYGQGFSENPDTDKYLTPIKVVLPEQADQVTATFHTVFVRGKSGKVYMAFRYVNNGPDMCIPDFILKTLPYDYGTSLFQPVNVGTVSQMAAGSVDHETAVYLLQSNGSVLFWNADTATREAFTPGYQTEIKPKMPEISFIKLESAGGSTNRIISAANSEYACFLAEDGSCVLFRNGAQVSGFKEKVKDACLTDNGLLFSDESGKLFFYGTDYEKLIAEGCLNSLKEITLVDHSF